MFRVCCDVCHIDRYTIKAIKKRTASKMIKRCTFRENYYIVC